MLDNSSPVYWLSFSSSSLVNIYLTWMGHMLQTVWINQMWQYFGIMAKGSGAFLYPSQKADSQLAGMKVRNFLNWNLVKVTNCWPSSLRSRTLFCWSPIPHLHSQSQQAEVSELGLGQVAVIHFQAEADIFISHIPAIHFFKNVASVGCLLHVTSSLNSKKELLQETRPTPHFLLFFFF